MKSLIDKFQLHVTFNVGTTQFIFKFNRDDFGQKNTYTSDDFVDILESATGKTISITMAKLYYEDTIIDIREKIYDTLTEIAQKGRLIDDLKKTGELNQ